MATSVKAYLAAPGSSFVSRNGETFSNKDEVANFCTSLWDQVEFVKSETQDCDWVVHPAGTSAPEHKKGKRSSKTYTINFHDFETYLAEHSNKKGSKKGSKLSASQESEAEIKNSISKKMDEIRDLQETWVKDQSPANWARLNQARTELDTMKTTGSMAATEEGRKKKRGRGRKKGTRKGRGRSRSRSKKRYSTSTETEMEVDSVEKPEKRTRSRSASAPKDANWKNYSATEETESEEARKKKKRRTKKKKSRKYSTTEETESETSPKKKRKSRKGKKKSTKGRKKSRKSRSRSRKSRK